MISFFPKPYKDEIYFSIIARYDRVTLNYSKDTLKELLGSNNKPLDIEYPLGVSYLVDQVRIFSKAYTVDYFLDNHTNYAFYKYFHKDILDSDISNTSFYKNIKYHRVKQIKKLKIKVCEKCLENNFVKYGDICVNRKHQLPGYFICRIHQIGLSNLKGTSVYNSSPKKFLPEYKDLEFEEINVPQKIFKELNSLENDTEYILENGKNLNINEFKNRCIEFLESKNLSLPQLKRADNIKKLLKQSFSQELFEYLGIDINEININKILNNTSHHIYVSELDYLKTILLMRALAGSVKNFFELKVEYKPFGELWMCMNPFCEYYKVRNIKKIKIGIHIGTRLLFGEVKCDNCGFTYRLKENELDPLAIPYFSNRIMEKGDVFVTKIHELAEQGYSKNAIARVANLSKPTISKILNDQYINKWRNLEEKRREKTKMYKEIWRKIYKENKHLSRTEISRMNRAAYVWLNKYNNEWLQKKLPPSRVGRIKKERQFNYIEFSHSILDLLQNWPTYERNSGKLVRRTMNILYLELGISLKHCDKYKDIAEAVNSFLESTLDFRKRKIDYLLANEFRNKFVSIYIIAERVGIRAVIRNGDEELKEYLISKIDEHNK